MTFHAILIACRTRIPPRLWEWTLVGILMPAMLGLAGCGRTLWGELEGTILQENQQDHEGTQVYLPGTQFRAITDPNGAFRITSIPPGSYTVVATADGYNTHRQEVEVKAGVRRSIGMVVLPRDIPPVGKISGFASLPGQSTHEGIILLLVGSPYSAATSTTGFYSLENIPPGTYTLLAFKEGWMPVSHEAVEVKVNEETQVPEMQLRPPGGMEEEKEPVEIVLGDREYTGSAFLLGSLQHEGIRVSLEDLPDKYTITSVTGAYVLDGIDDVTHTLVFSKEGYRTITLADAVPGEATAPIPLPFVTLPRERKIGGTGILQGRIFLAGQATHANTVVRLTGVSQSVATDPDGRFMFVGIPDGNYPLTAEHPGYQTGKVDSVTIHPDQISQIEDQSLEPLPGQEELGEGSLHGIAYLANQTDHAGILVALEGTTLNTVTGPSGDYVFDAVPSGAYLLILSKDGYKNYYTEGIAIQADTTLELDPVILQPDVDPPYVIDTFPSLNARWVPVDRYVDVIVRFSERMDGPSVKQAAIIEPPVDFDAFFDRESEFSNIDVLHLRLYQQAPMPVLFNTRYLVTITPAAQTPKGIPLAEPFQFTFTTDGPLILRTVPMQGDNNFLLGIGNPIWFETNALVDLNSIQRALRIRPKPDADPMLQTVPTATGSQVMIYLNLRPNTRYRMMLDHNMKTMDGQRFSNTPFSLTFKTMSNQSANSIDGFGRNFRTTRRQ